MRKAKVERVRIADINPDKGPHLEHFRLPWRIEFLPDFINVFSASGAMLMHVPGRNPAHEDALCYMISAINRDGQLKTDPRVQEAMKESMQKYGDPGWGVAQSKPEGNA
jgi:hypothetical protein